MRPLRPGEGLYLDSTDKPYCVVRNDIGPYLLDIGAYLVEDEM
jgi:hypothetical protein